MYVHYSDLAEVCAIQSVLKIKLNGDITVVIVPTQFRKNPFVTFRVILITDRQKDTHKGENITSFNFVGGGKH